MNQVTTSSVLRQPIGLILARRIGLIEWIGIHYSLFTIHYPVQFFGEKIHGFLV